MKSLIHFTLLSGFVAVALLFTSCGGSSGGGKDKDSMKEEDAPSSLENSRLIGELEIADEYSVKLKNFSFSSGTATFARVENGDSTTLSGVYSYNKRENSSSGSLTIRVYGDLLNYDDGSAQLEEINIDPLEFDVSSASSNATDFNNASVKATGTVRERKYDTTEGYWTVTTRKVTGTFTYVLYSGV